MEIDIDFNVRQAENGFVVNIYGKDGSKVYVCGSFAQVKKLLQQAFAPKPVAVE